MPRYRYKSLRDSRWIAIRLNDGKKNNNPISEFVVQYMEEFKTDSQNIAVDFNYLRKFFYSHIKELYNLIGDCYEGVRLPYGLGKFQVKRYKPKNPTKSWFLRRLYKKDPSKVIYDNNIETDGFKFHMHYIKIEDKQKYALYANKNIYRFQMALGKHAFDNLLKKFEKNYNNYRLH